METAPLPTTIPQAAWDDLHDTTEKLIREQARGISVARLVGACAISHDFAVAEAFLLARADLVPSYEPGVTLFKAI